METDFYGVHLICDTEKGGYFLQSDNGDEQFFPKKPSKEEIEKFADECSRF